MSLLSILLLGVIVVRFYWEITDPRSIKERISWYFKPGNLLLVIVDAIIAVLVIICTKYYPLPKTALDTLIISIGIIMYLIGFILAMWARFTMKRYWAPAHTGHNIKKQTRLVMNGPFKYTRNPIYLGLLLLYFGFFIALRSFLVVLVFLLLMRFYQAAIIEETLLEKHFGKKYLEYKSKTPRFI